MVRYRMRCGYMGYVICINETPVKKNIDLDHLNKYRNRLINSYTDPQLLI